MRRNITMSPNVFLGAVEIEKPHFGPGFLKNVLGALEGECDVFCYECHEILLHNPVFTRENILDFADLVNQKQLNEVQKTRSNEKLRGRVRLLHEVIELGLRALKGKSGCNS